MSESRVFAPLILSAWAKWRVDASASIIGMVG